MASNVPEKDDSSDQGRDDFEREQLRLFLLRGAEERCGMANTLVL